MIADRRYVTIEETASILAVSQATVRNWIKHDYLRPAGREGRLFRSEEVRALRDGIVSGSVPRLARRANKATASRSFIPDEYVDEGVSREAIGTIVAQVRAGGIEIGRALFLLALGRLVTAGMLCPGGAEEFFLGGTSAGGREYALREMREWHAELGGFGLTARYRALLGLDLPDQRDSLGLVYQSLLREGDKAAGGSYYTPDRIVRGIADDMYRPGALVLDPCCGTGQFLLAFAGKTGDPETLYGTDIDAVAVRLARINLMMAFPDRDFTPRIYRSNILREGVPAVNGFDLIATNPPWGLHYDRQERAGLCALYPEIVSGESFSYILKKSIDLLNEGGSLSFLLPESILYVRTHADIRNHILKHARIERIARLGRVFKNVFTPVIRLDLARGGKPALLRCVSGAGDHAVDQERFLANGDFVFDINVNSTDGRILDRVYDCGHTTLEGKADWALGIVTGDNGRFISPEGGRAGYEPIFTGKEVDHYLFRPPACYIRYAPEKFQQAAPERKYRAPEKLVYRFISKKLVVAYDDRGRLTLNSANILIPLIERYPVKAMLALLNSSLYQFIFQKKFSSIKVLRSHLERMPLPLWDAEELDRLASIADEIMTGRAGLRDADGFIMDRFGLTAAEREHIARSIS